MDEFNKYRLRQSMDELKQSLKELIKSLNEVTEVIHKYSETAQEEKYDESRKSTSNI